MIMRIEAIVLVVSLFLRLVSLAAAEAVVDPVASSGLGLDIPYPAGVNVALSAPYFVQGLLPVGEDDGLLTRFVPAP